MKTSDIPDPHIEFKRYFVQCVNNYLKDPTDKKQAKLKDIVQKSIHLDQDLLFGLMLCLSGAILLKA